MPRPTSPTLRIIGTEYGPRFCARATALATFLGTRISTFRSSLRRARPSSLRLFWLAFRWVSGALAADNRRFSARIDIIGRARLGRGSEADGVGRGSLGGGLARLPSRGFRVGRGRRGLAPGPVSVPGAGQSLHPELSLPGSEFWRGYQARRAACSGSAARVPGPARGSSTTWVHRTQFRRGYQARRPAGRRRGYQARRAACNVFAVPARVLGPARGLLAFESQSRRARGWKLGARGSRQSGLAARRWLGAQSQPRRARVEARRPRVAAFGA